MKKLFFPLVLAVFCLISSAGLAVTDHYVSVAENVKYQYIGEYSVERLNQILTQEAGAFTSKKIKFSPAKNAVKLYKVIYGTVIPEQNNRPTEVSGLVAVPEIKADKLPVVSYQHGTVFNRTSVPSNPDDPYSTETRLMVARFAGNGYVVIAPDYLGKGVSTEPDGFVVRDSTAQTCLDLLLAAQEVLSSLKVSRGDLFLSGWSQGAYNTVLFLNKLEAAGIPVKASVAVCTPSDPYALVVRFINVQTDLDVNWAVGVIGLIINSYEQYYNLPGLSRAAIKPQYWQAAHDLYTNKKSWPEVESLLPATTRDLLQEDFIKAASLGNDGFFQKLRENAAYRWRYKTPTRFYWGQIDEVITPYLGTLPVDYQKMIGGATSQAVFAGKDANHRGAFLYAVRDQKNWFDELLSIKKN